MKRKIEKYFSSKQKHNSPSSDDIFYSGIPNELWGKKTTISELEEIFGDEMTVVNDSKWQKSSYLIFGIEGNMESDNVDERMPRYLAYECPNCNELIIGPPKEEEYNDLDPKHLSGSKGKYIKCSDCDSIIGREKYICS